MTRARLAIPSPVATLLLAAALPMCTLALPGQAIAQEKPRQLWIQKTTKDRALAIKSSSFAELAEDVSPSVVNIITTVSLSGPFSDDSDAPPDSGATAVGSGFIIHPDGYILTNNHVIENAISIRVRLNDKREFDAEIVGTDPRTDVALVKVVEENEKKKTRFKAIALGDSDAVKVGENVLAVGNPLGLNHTVTSGIVSALGRKDLAPGGKTLESDFIQTDASINPGNSGGPLISLDGQVIGINTLVNTQGQGIGFAIPINVVKALLPQLHETGYVIRTWLGVRVQSVTPALARSFGLDSSSGALVSEVVKDSPASRAGLVDGDIILSFNGTRIRHSDQLPWLVSTGGTRTPVAVEILRAGSRATLDLSLEALPDQEPPPRSMRRAVVKAAIAQSRLDEGIQVRALDEALARKLGARDIKGVAIISLADNAPIKEAGLRQRDVIVQIDQLDINSPTELDAALKGAIDQPVVRFKVVRSGKQMYLAFEPK